MMAKRAEGLGHQHHARDVHLVAFCSCLLSEISDLLRMIEMRFHDDVSALFQRLAEMALSLIQEPCLVGTDLFPMDVIDDARVRRMPEIIIGDALRCLGAEAMHGKVTQQRRLTATGTTGA